MQQIEEVLIDKSKKFKGCDAKLEMVIDAMKDYDLDLSWVVTGCK